MSNLKLVDTPPAPSASKTTQWDALPEKKRRVAYERLQLIKPIIDHVNTGASRRNAIDNFLLRIAAGTVTPVIAQLAMQLGRNKKPPTRATLYRWVNSYLDEGIAALAPAHKGSERTFYGWEARAQHLYAQPQQPDAAAVAGWLRDEGWDTATPSRVRSYLQSLPTDLTTHASGRLGAKFRRDTQKLHVHRDTSNIPVGAIYQGDGHCCDVYVAHPNTGKIWRPELTAWIDVRSRYLAGWYLSEAESALTTLFALSHALLTHDHVPAMIHVDRGSGFISKMMSNQSAGYYAQFALEPIYALPGNAKGKGQIERWFGTMERQHGKRFDTYCGEDMAPEVLRRITNEVNTGKRQLPSLAEYAQKMAAYIERYNNTPHRALDGATPAQLWAKLDKTPVHTPAAAVVRPRHEVSVKRETIRMHNRVYHAPELMQFLDKRMIAEYDIHDDSGIRVLDKNGRFVCEATLVDKRAYMPASRLEEAQQKRLAGQQQRLQRKLDEAKKRSARIVDHTEQLNNLTALEDITPDTIDSKTVSDTDINLNDLIDDTEHTHKPFDPTFADLDF